ncbi:hypothetical protein OIU76_007168 [Salix suchowensis]|uniref:Uncharacterized protein n=1 Tax=Salix koriyanagi TaxID=2511006 RepID=A0A9Q0TD29_9ROSI|nr:hypothetical protein OIU76_007168 [Salix suchowensis]KAJ6709399.1 hypothetical protein OIU74_010491 [Salix koriyanagi]
MHSNGPPTPFIGWTGYHLNHEDECTAYSILNRKKQSPQTLFSHRFIIFWNERRTMAAGKENVKHLEECSVSNALGTWVFSVAGALLAIPVGIKRKSFAPLVFFGTTGTMLDIIMGISQCEREHAERQAKLLEAQNSAGDASITLTGSES